MSPSSILLALSLVLRFAAFGWSLALLNRLRDWRMGVLSGLLAAMATSTALTLYTHVGGGAVSLGDEHKFFQELPELVISLIAVLFVLLLGRILSARQTQSHRLYEAEEKLRSNEARLRVMLEQMPAIVWTTDLELRFSSSAGAALDDLGLEADQVVGHTLYDFFKTTDKKFPAIAAHLQALEGKSVEYEQDWGGQRYRVVVETMRDTEGEIVGVLGVALDVTDLVVSERALMASEARYQDFLVQTSEGIWRVELDESIAVEASEDDQIEHFYRYGSLAECSDAFAKMFGLTSASVLVDARLDEILPRDDRNNLEHLRTFIRRDYRLAEAYSSEQDEKGRDRHFINSLTGIVEDGQLLRIWGIRRDVTDHKEADRALKASEEKYRELFEVSQDTIFISTPEGRLIDINPAGVRLLGYAGREELLNVDVGRDLYADPEKRAEVVEMLNSHGSCRDFELRLRRGDGSEIVVQETTTVVRDSEGKAVAYRGMLRDVSRQRSLEEQLQGAQRMEAVGRLAGGVAHDFNNLLTVINGRNDLLRTMIDDDSPLVREVEEIKQAGERAAALTRQLLILSRRPIGSPKALSVNRVIEDVGNLLRRSIGAQIELITDLDKSLPSINADETQIEQVLLNLALNARDAMVEGGTLTIKTEAITIGESSSLHSLGLKHGPYVLLRIEDTGVGIDPAIRGRIFEPFVTTKDPSQGTGLGLSTVYGVVQQSEGHIRVESQPGRGACFEVFLPAVEASVEAAGAAPEATSPPGGNETILLVEDEGAVRSLLRRFLDSQGYVVIEASNAESALSEAENQNGSIDLLLTDLVMPGMGGFELARQLGSRLPDLKIVYMSGYSEEAVGVPEAEPVMDSTNFLQKPFSTDLLARQLRVVLDSE